MFSSSSAAYRNRIYVVVATPTPGVYPNHLQNCDLLNSKQTYRLPAADSEGAPEEPELVGSV